MVTGVGEVEGMLMVTLPPRYMHTRRRKEKKKKNLLRGNNKMMVGISGWLVQYTNEIILACVLRDGKLGLVGQLFFLGAAAVPCEAEGIIKPMKKGWGRITKKKACSGRERYVDEMQHHELKTSDRIFLFSSSASQRKTKSLCFLQTKQKNCAVKI